MDDAKMALSQRVSLCQ